MKHTIYHIISISVRRRRMFLLGAHERQNRFHWGDDRSAKQFLEAVHAKCILFAKHTVLFINIEGKRCNAFLAIFFRFCYRIVRRNQRLQLSRNIQKRNVWMYDGRVFFGLRDWLEINNEVNNRAQLCLHVIEQSFWMIIIWFLDNANANNFGKKSSSVLIDDVSSDSFEFLKLDTSWFINSSSYPISDIFNRRNSKMLANESWFWKTYELQFLYPETIECKHQH